MELSANRRRRLAPNFLPGQKVWLLRRHLSTTRPSLKLDVRRQGPFAIIAQVRTSAFRLDLPPSMHIHPRFHVSLLEKHVANTFLDRLMVPPPPLHVDGLPEFEVHEILDSRLRRGELQYLVDWVGYDVSERSWQPIANLENAKSAINNFRSKFPFKPHPLVISI